MGQKGKVSRDNNQLKKTEKNREGGGWAKKAPKKEKKEKVFITQRANWRQG